MTDVCFCQYPYCKNQLMAMDESVHLGRAYYHTACIEKMLTKKSVAKDLHMFFENSEDYTKILKCIKKYIDDDGFEPFYVFFALNKILKEKLTLHGMEGFERYLHSKLMKQQYDEYMAQWNKKQEEEDKQKKNDKQEEDFSKRELSKIQKKWDDLIG